MRAIVVQIKNEMSRRARLPSSTAKASSIRKPRADPRDRLRREQGNHHDGEEFAVAERESRASTHCSRSAAPIRSGRSKLCHRAAAGRRNSGFFSSETKTMKEALIRAASPAWRRTGCWIVRRAAERLLESSYPGEHASLLVQFIEMPLGQRCKNTRTGVKHCFYLPLCMAPVGLQNDQKSDPAKKKDGDEREKEREPSAKVRRCQVNSTRDTELNDSHRPNPPDHGANENPV